MARLKVDSFKTAPHLAKFTIWCRIFQLSLSSVPGNLKDCFTP